MHHNYVAELAPAAPSLSGGFGFLHLAQHAVHIVPRLLPHPLPLSFTLGLLRLVLVRSLAHDGVLVALRVLMHDLQLVQQSGFLKGEKRQRKLLYHH